MLFLAGTYINMTIDHEFEDFVRTTHMSERQNIINAVSEIVEEAEDTRQPREQMALNQLSRTHNERIIIKDNDGQIVHDTNVDGPGPPEERGPMRGSMDGDVQEDSQTNNMGRDDMG